MEKNKLIESIDSLVEQHMTAWGTKDERDRLALKGIALDAVQLGLDRGKEIHESVYGKAVAS